MRNASRKPKESADARSGCPINLSIEVIGDRWSPLVIRDMMFGNRHHFGELLAGSEEGIASNILADRLRRLAEQGMISRAPDPSHKQKVIYSLMLEQGGPLLWEELMDELREQHLGSRGRPAPSRCSSGPSRLEAELAKVS